ncbi:hypothetical protein VTN31DRAFT_3172 [Thermomyces dupontii]|uniref:uncharacterized protein n=1 Tax=Talaromyces thermophilus TaxID=28565 RepID=UPI003743F8FF
MSLVQHQHRLDDLWTDDLFNHAEVLSERLLKEPDSLMNGYDLDEEWPLTPAQRQMLGGDLSPWCHINLILPRRSAPDATRIRSAWKQLCSLREFASYLHPLLATDGVRQTVACALCFASIRCKARSSSVCYTILQILIGTLTTPPLHPHPILPNWRVSEKTM